MTCRHVRAARALKLRLTDSSTRASKQPHTALRHIDDDAERPVRLMRRRRPEQSGSRPQLRHAPAPCRSVDRLSEGTRHAVSCEPQGDVL